MSEYLRFVESLKAMGVDYYEAGSGFSRRPIMITFERFNRILSWWFDGRSEKLVGVGVDFVFEKI